MKKSYILLLLVFTASINFNAFSQEDEKSGWDASVGTDLVSRYIWRGLASSKTPALQPYLEVSNGGFAIGTWASYTIGQEIIQEIEELLEAAKVKNSHLIIISGRTKQLNNKVREIKERYAKILLSDPFLPKELLPKSISLALPVNWVIATSPVLVVLSTAPFAPLARGTSRVVPALTNKLNPLPLLLFAKTATLFDEASLKPRPPYTVEL